MTGIDRQVADAIAKANETSVTKVGLRFDKVVVRLFENLRAYAEEVVPQRKAILLTLTAPIKLPAKTEDELKLQIKELLESGGRRRDKTITIFQNKVRLRVIGVSTKQALKFVGFVHNPSTDSNLLLDRAARWVGQV